MSLVEQLLPVLETTVESCQPAFEANAAVISFLLMAWYFQRLTVNLHDPLLQRNHARLSSLVLRGRIGATHRRRDAWRERQHLDERGATRRRALHSRGRQQ